MKDEGRILGSEVDENVLAKAVERILALVQGDDVGISEQPGLIDRQMSVVFVCTDQGSPEGVLENDQSLSGVASMETSQRTQSEEQSIQELAGVA